MEGIYPSLYAYGAVLLLYLFGLIANITLIYTIYVNKKFHTPSYILSVSMAISDMMLMISSGLFTILSIIQNTGSPIDSLSYFVICQCNSLSFVSSYTVSALSFMTISIDRYFTINLQPNSKSLLIKPFILYTVIISIWLIGISTSIPVVLMVKPIQNSNNICSLENFRDTNLALLLAHIFNIIITFPIPLTTICVLYYRITQKLKSLPVPLNHCSNGIGSSNRRRIQATKMMMIATISFVINTSILYTVSIVLGSLDPFAVATLFQSPTGILSALTITSLLTASETIQNPILFYCYNKTFRQAVLSIRCCRKI
ncbi:Substance-K receptor [Trichoplax sp. H2]|nr:Substance-K receptor [Trichoplax sp. H2]|eukprot:RDD36981.1 Substance-K receptor [Trichoplax sp. H2]